MRSRLRDRTDQVLSHRKARDRAMILPLIGLILLTPPVGGIFHLGTKVAGVPFTLVYVFVVWALLIVGAMALSRRLRTDDETGTSSTRPEPGLQPGPQPGPAD